MLARRASIGPSSRAAPAPVTSGPERLDEGVWRTELPGGPIVLTERIEGLRSVAVGLWFRQGSAFEPVAERGISHLLEHMVFKGTRRRSARDLVLEIERIGGAVDAYTSHESTAFQARVPEGSLPGALDVLADLAFQPALRRRDLESERNVILEELAGVEESPEDLAFELHGELLYGDHPYGARILGSPETLSRLDEHSVRRLHRESYRAGNAVVAAAGRVDHAELIELVRRYVPEGVAAARSPLPEAHQAASGHRRHDRPGGRQTHLVAGALTVPFGHRLRYAITVVDTALGAGMSSRLFQRLREELGLAYHVYSFHAFYDRGGHGGAYVSTGPETASLAREALLEEFRRLADEGLGPEEVRETKEQLKGRLLLSLESAASRMNRLAALSLYDEPYRTVEELAGRIEAVTEEELREAAALLHPDRLAVLELAPA